MLTLHQSDILNQALDILKVKNRLVIKGSAGVGKTYLVNELIKSLNRTKNLRKILCSAPTNQAVAVLRGKVDDMMNLEFVTTHSALKLKRSIDTRSGKYLFKPRFDPRYPPLDKVALLVVDEASMISRQLLAYLEEFADLNGTIIVFIGDHKQLPPVGEDSSPVFDAGYDELELTEIIRQGPGNPIIDLSRNLSWINTPQEVLNEKGEGFTNTYDYQKIITRLAEADGTDEFKYLAYTNDNVDTVNHFVRKKIYNEPDKIELNEKLIFNAPYGTDNYTNKELFVRDLDVTEVEVFYPNSKYGSDRFSKAKLKVYVINNGSMSINNYLPSGILIVHEDSADDFKRINNELLGKAKAYDITWKSYYEFIELFAQIKYSHALTVHKSQGSTFLNVFLNVKDLNINKKTTEREKLFYTGVTRASNLLILYDI